MQTFSVGDVVGLRTGGPAMTVWGVRDDGLVDTCWFIDAALHRDTFGPEELLLFKPCEKAA